MDKTRIKEITERFKGRRLVVLGDLMLDEFIWGDVRRISPEAPVPVVEVRRESSHLGGAGNVVSNLISLGAQVTVAGFVGNDAAGEAIRRRCADAGADVTAILTDESRPTTRKTRVVAHSQQMVRFDREDRRPVSSECEEAIRAACVRAIDGAEGLIVSDYEKGAVTAALLTEVIELAHKSGKPVLVDPKMRNWSYYRKVDVLTPNQREAELATSIEIVDRSSLESAAMRIRDSLDCRNVLITRGERGMGLLGESGKLIEIPTVAREVFDVTGAGDTVIATLALGLVAGATIEEASIIANHAAGVVVGKVGTATVSLAELVAAMNEKRNHGTYGKRTEDTEGDLG
jgi:rfaE bifunctional protein kinase chain/domain